MDDFSVFLIGEKPSLFSWFIEFNFTVSFFWAIYLAENYLYTHIYLIYIIYFIYLYIHSMIYYIYIINLYLIALRNLE